MLDVIRDLRLFWVENSLWVWQGLMNVDGKAFEKPHGTLFDS